MQEKDIRIFALNPGSRYAGIAVFRGPELIDWGMKKSAMLKSCNNWSERLKSFVSEAIERDGINRLAIKRLHPARSSEYLRNLTDELKVWAMKRGLIVHEYTIKEVESILLPSDMLNKRRLMEEVAATHPILYQELEKERQNRNPYVVRMFEAVALGMKCLSDLEKSKGRISISVDYENTKE